MVNTPFANATQSTSQNEPASALDVSAAVLRGLHVTIGQQIPLRADGTAFYLQSGAYLNALIMAMTDGVNIKSQTANMAYVMGLHSDQLPVAEQILRNTALELNRVAKSNEYVRIGLFINAMRDNLGLSSISWSGSPAPQLSA